jgi:ATP-dependent DNA helicase RecG
VANPLDAKLTAAVGPRTAAALERGLGLVTVGDLLSHYPRRYASRGELTEIAKLPLDENVTIVAEVISVSKRAMRQKRGSIVEATIGDGRGTVTLTFFNQPYRAEDLRPGRRGIFAGKVGEYRGQRQLAHPNYALFDDDPEREAKELERADHPIPIYPATSTVASWQIAAAVEVALDTLGQLEDPVPLEVRASRSLLPFARALELVHRPTSDADWARARASLRFQEAFVLQSALLLQRARAAGMASVARQGGPLLAAFDAALPFELTDDQRRVGSEVAADIGQTHPMNRLLQGEVGSGKTLVALRAMLAVAEAGGQSALLAPTEVLAAQHVRSIVASLGPDLAARLRPTLITGQMPVAERRKATLAAVSGSSLIVVGTHALLGDRVEFYDLGLVVVDEQHRFGVEQREALRAKGLSSPHVLVLTATPIPRTVAMTVFGDLDVSTITQLPAGRTPIESFVVPLAERPGWHGRVWQRMAEELAQGRQAFVVCPAIDPATGGEDEELLEGAPSAPPVANVTETLAHLRGMETLAGSRIEALTGRMSAEEKDATMRAFAEGRIDVLVATTVIEVGVDVPNASTMVVLDADRFGVSQLHQLRGRVGRGGVPGLCLFVTSAPLETLGRERVDAVASTLDGFELAEKDLELRHEGDVLGSTQSGGRSSLRILRVARDGEVIAAAREAASGVLDADPSLVSHPALREALARRLDEETESFLAKN